MKRHYFIGKDLGELEILEHELEAEGLVAPQVHVLSEDERGLQRHHLNASGSVVSGEVVYAVAAGLLVGLVVAATLLVFAYLSGFSQDYSWIPVLFLASVVLVFSVWEGGFVGLQGALLERERFSGFLHDGKHVLLVDVDEKQLPLLRRTVSRHPDIQPAGTGGAPGWVVGLRRRLQQLAH